MKKDKRCKVNAQKVNRLNKVINFLEAKQSKHYSTNLELILSYLRDIRDGTVPKYVMKKGSK